MCCSMFNRRLLLLGVSALFPTLFLTSGWTPPKTTIDSTELYRTSDTDREATMRRHFAAPAFTSGSAVAFGQLYIATTVGGSNGVRLNPKALNFVEDYMKENWEELESLRSWGRPYFSLIESILGEYGLPKELKYLAVIESNLKSTAVSRVGAKGPWQLMPQTARDLGLKVNKNVDERKNYVKSTRAAALYLRDLQQRQPQLLGPAGLSAAGIAAARKEIHRYAIYFRRPGQRHDADQGRGHRSTVGVGNVCFPPHPDREGAG